MCRSATLLASIRSIRPKNQAISKVGRAEKPFVRWERTQGNRGLNNKKNENKNWRKIRYFYSILPQIVSNSDKSKKKWGLNFECSSSPSRTQPLFCDLKLAKLAYIYLTKTGLETLFFVRFTQIWQRCVGIPLANNNKGQGEPPLPMMHLTST